MKTNVNKVESQTYSFKAKTALYLGKMQVIWELQAL